MQTADHSWRPTTAALIALFLLGGMARAQTGPVRINEFMTRNATVTNVDGRITDWIELYNTATTNVNLQGYSLTDSNLFPTRFVFPPGVVIPAQGFLLVTCDSSQPSSPTNASFGLGADGGYVFLYAPGNPTPVDWVPYGVQPEDYSMGRVPDGTGGWKLCSPTPRGTNVAVALGRANALRINEWMANEAGGGKDWFEIYNTTNKPVQLSDLWLNDPGAAYRIPSNSYIGHGFKNGFQVFIADDATNAYRADWVNFKLGNSDSLTLRSNDYNTVLHTVSWASSANGVSQGFLPDGNTAGGVVAFAPAGDYITASKGEANWLPHPSIIVNEVLSHTDPPFEDAVEFQNIGATAVDISGWWMSNAKTDPWRARIPAGVPIPPGGFRVIYEYQFNRDATNYPPGYPTTNILTSFTFNSARGDQVYLFQTGTGGALTGYRAIEAFEPAANGISFGRYYPVLPNTPGDYKFVAQSQTTFGRDNPLTVEEFRLGTGATNAYPKVGPVVINEIMYNYGPTYFNGTNWVEDPNDEFIELRNTTTDWQPLFDPNFPTNKWRLQKAVNFTFTNYTWMAPNSYCLIVGFDPIAAPATLNAFRARYGVSNTVPVYGPWRDATGTNTARLSNTGDAVELYRPDTPQFPPHPDAGLVPYVRVDKVNYQNTLPWPTAASGQSNSLQKANSLAFGNDANTWRAERPTAGRSRIKPFPDNDDDDMSDTWETTYGLNPASAADAQQDRDGDGMTNLQEFLANTNPTNAASRLALAIDYPNTNAPLRLIWEARSNLSYTVFYKNKFELGRSWKVLTNVAAVATNRPAMQVVDPSPPAVDRYYQLTTP